MYCQSFRKSALETFKEGTWKVFQSVKEISETYFGTSVFRVAFTDFGKLIIVSHIENVFFFQVIVHIETNFK